MTTNNTKLYPQEKATTNLVLLDKKYADPRLGPLGHRVYELYENGRLIAAQHSTREYVAAYVRKFPDGITFELLPEIPTSIPEGVYGLATLEIAYTSGEPVITDENGLIVIEPKIVTEYDPKPIPTDKFDWIAFYEGREEEGCGNGASEQEAIKELREMNSYEVTF